MKKFLNRFIHDESGQSLMEIIVGLTIGAILIGTASFGIAFTLRSTSTNQNLGNASQLTQGLLNSAQTLAFSNWQNIYGLSKYSTNQYFLNASGTSYIAVNGQEGVIDNDVTNGLVGKWGLDEATGTVAYDATGNNNNGSFVGNPTHASSTCKVANCLGFRGADAVGDYVNVNYSSKLNVFSGTTWTVTMWVKPTSGGPATYTILNGRYHKPRIIVNTTSAFLEGFVSSTFTSILSTTGITSDQWNHVVFYADGVTNKIFINGTEKASGAYKQLDSPPFDQLHIGASGWSSENFWGNIDDVRIYNRALSASEVTRLYNSQVFSRYFYVENVCRTNDSSAGISTTTSPCPGGTADDPLTQKVTAITSWSAGAGIDQVSLGRYITRWGNFAIRQTDWAGGTGQDGPLISPNDRYSSSTNIISTSTLGSFQILNLSQQ